MVKKVTRTRTMRDTIAESKALLKKPEPKTKKIVRTRSIQRTINQANEFERIHKINDGRKIRLERRAKIAKKQENIKLNVPPIRPSKKVEEKKVSKVEKEKVEQKDQKSKPIKKTRVNNTNITNNLPVSNFGTIDICFCIDATGSMGSYLDQAKSTVLSIISKVQSKVQMEGIELRFAVVTYRDHPPQESSYVTTVKDFTNDSEIRKYINTMSAQGGGDEPEAIHDGLLDCAKKLTWKNTQRVPTLRYIFHIADAPPHGNEFVKEEKQKGCTCGIQTSDVIHAINLLQIHYRLIKVGSNSRVDQMQKIFKKSLTNMESVTINSASELDIRVSDMIIRELVPL